MKPQAINGKCKIKSACIDPCHAFRLVQDQILNVLIGRTSESCSAFIFNLYPTKTTDIVRLSICLEESTDPLAELSGKAIVGGRPHPYQIQQTTTNGPAHQAGYQTKWQSEVGISELTHSRGPFSQYFASYHTRFATELEAMLLFFDLVIPWL